jgi:hypothetical protein
METGGQTHALFCQLHISETLAAKQRLTARLLMPSERKPLAWKWFKGQERALSLKSVI